MKKRSTKIVIFFVVAYYSADAGRAAAATLQPTAIARVTEIKCVVQNEGGQVDGDETYYEKNGNKSRIWDLSAGENVVLKMPGNEKGAEIFSAHRGNVLFSLREDDTDLLDPDDNFGDVTLHFDSGKFTTISNPGTKPATVAMSDHGSKDGLHQIVLTFFGEQSSYEVTIEVEEELAGANVCVLITLKEGPWKNTANEPTNDTYDELQIFCARQAVEAGKPQTALTTWKPSQASYYNLQPGLKWTGFDGSPIDAPIIGYGTITETRQLRIHADFRELDEPPQPLFQETGWFNVELTLKKTPTGYDVEHKWVAGRDVEFRVSGSTTPVNDVTLRGVKERASIRMFGAGVEYHFLGTIFLGNTEECKD